MKYSELNIVNEKLTISYHDFYKDTKSLKALINMIKNDDVFYLLSLLSSSEDARKEIQKYMLSIASNVRQLEYLTNDKYILAGDLSICYLFFELIKNNHSYPNKTLNNYKDIFNLIIKLNDLDPNLVNKSNRKETLSLLAGLHFQHYRDNALSMFRRAYELFLNSTELDHYKDLFLNSYKISLEDYVYYIHFLNVYFDNLSHSTTLDNYKQFYVDVDFIIKHYSLNEQKLKTILEIISFENHNIITKTNSEYLDIVRNKPFYKVANSIYLLVNKKFAQELLYVNVFHKLLNLNDDKKSRSLFLTKFGQVFERYVVSIAKNWSSNNTFDFIPEFIIKGNDKSPDLLVVNYKKKEVIAFEVKSARVLKTYTDSFINTDAFKQTIEKQMRRPLEQLKTALEKIIQQKSKKIDETFKFFLCSITFDSIPLIPTLSFKYETGEDLPFLNFSIETFEVFIRLITSEIFSKNYSTYDLLGNYVKNYSSRMSLKNYLYRMEKKLECSNPSFNKSFIDSQNDYISKIYALNI